MFIDFVKIYIKSGNGGHGALSFHREKYVQAGGPDGGNGGNGGDVVLVADADMRTLLDFHFQKHFSADNGENGAGNLRTGARGKNVEIHVPRGTIVKDAESGLILADMFHAGEKSNFARRQRRKRKCQFCFGPAAYTQFCPGRGGHQAASDRVGVKNNCGCRIGRLSQCREVNDSFYDLTGKA